MVLAQRLRYCVFGRRRLRLNDDGGQGRLTTVMIDQHCANHACRGHRQDLVDESRGNPSINSRARIAMVPTLVAIELDRLKRSCGRIHKRVWPQSVRETPGINCDLRDGRRFSMCSRGNFTAADTSCSSAACAMICSWRSGYSRFQRLPKAQRARPAPRRAALPGQNVGAAEERGAAPGQADLNRALRDKRSLICSRSSRETLLPS